MKGGVTCSSPLYTNSGHFTLEPSEIYKYITLRDKVFSSTVPAISKDKSLDNPVCIDSTDAVSVGHQPILIDYDGTAEPKKKRRKTSVIYGPTNVGRKGLSKDGHQMPIIAERLKTESVGNAVIALHGSESKKC